MCALMKLRQDSFLALLNLRAVMLHGIFNGDHFGAHFFSGANLESSMRDNRPEFNREDELSILDVHPRVIREGHQDFMLADGVSDDGINLKASKWQL